MMETVVAKVQVQIEFSSTKEREKILKEKISRRTLSVQKDPSMNRTLEIKSRFKASLNSPLYFDPGRGPVV